MQKTIGLNVLDNVEIATPCTASWEEMTGNDQTRYCSHCSLNVYNLSAMTREEATGIIAGAEGRVCIRLYRRTDGTVLTQDCPTGLRAARERVSRSIRNIAATVATLVAGIIGLGAKQAWAQGGVTPRHIMGGMAAPHRTDPDESQTKRDTVGTKHDTAEAKHDTSAIDNSRTEIMGKMTISRAEVTPAPMQLDMVTTRPVVIEPAVVDPVMFEPIGIRPIVVEPTEVGPAVIEHTVVEPAVTEPVTPTLSKTEPDAPQLSFVMGEMAIIDTPTSEPVNPAAQPQCDPNAPVVDAIAGPDIK